MVQQLVQAVPDEILGVAVGLDNATGEEEDHGRRLFLFQSLDQPGCDD